MDDQQMDCAREVLLRLGRAVCDCQVVELLVYGSLLCLKRSGLKCCVEDFFSDDPKKRGPMLGELRQALEKVAKLPSGLEKRLREFVKLRNRVIHRLFTEPSAIQPQTTETAQAKLALIDKLTRECQYFGDLFLGFLAHFPRPDVGDDELATEIKQIYARADSLRPKGEVIIGAVLKAQSGDRC